jgi:nitroreductase
MCRHFRPDPVSSELVDRLLGLATRAPSAGHTQGWAWLVLSTPASIASFWSATSSSVESVPPGISVAPVIIVPLCSRAAYEDRYSQPDKAAFDWDVPYWMVDAGMATMILLLAAADVGLGALFFRLHRPAADFRSAFGVPDEWAPIGAVAMGWPADDGAATRRRRRRALDEVVHRGFWQGH